MKFVQKCVHNNLHEINGGERESSSKGLIIFSNKLYTWVNVIFNNKILNLRKIDIFTSSAAQTSAVYFLFQIIYLYFCMCVFFEFEENINPVILPLKILWENIWKSFHFNQLDPALINDVNKIPWKNWKLYQLLNTDWKKRDNGRASIEHKEA